jgi:hypothetical protein
MNTFGVLDCDLVAHVIAADRRESFDHMQLIAVEIPGSIEPGAVPQTDCRSEANSLRALKIAL